MRRTATSSFVLTALAAMVLLLDTSNSLMTFAGAFAVFWLLLGGWPAIAPAYGIMFQAYGLGAILGALYSGRLNELFGSYRAVLWPILLASLAGMLISWWGFSGVRGDERESPSA